MIKKILPLIAVLFASQALAAGYSSASTPPPWSTLTDPTTALTLTMGTNKTTWTTDPTGSVAVGDANFNLDMGTQSGAGVLMDLRTANGATATGSVLRLAAGSTFSTTFWPLDVRGSGTGTFPAGNAMRIGGVFELNGPFDLRDTSAANATGGYINFGALPAAPRAGSPISGDFWWNGTALNFYNGATTTNLLVPYTLPDATAVVKGGIFLTGDLGGTAASPSVVDDSHAHTTTTISGLDAGADFTAGTLPIARGGTNGTATPTLGAVAYGTGTALAWSAAPGATGDCLKGDTTGSPTWGSCAAGGGYATVQEEGAALTQRTTINFIGGSMTCVDNPGSSRTDCTLSASGLTLPQVLAVTNNAFGGF